MGISFPFNFRGTVHDGEEIMKQSILLLDKNGLLLKATAFRAMTMEREGRKGEGLEGQSFG